MRLFLMTVLCCGTMLGQQQKSPEPKPTRYFGLAPFGQPRAPATPTPDLGQQKKDLVGLLEQWHGQLDSGLAGLTIAKITLAPGQACSIPLLKVLPGKTNDRMTIPMRAPSNVDHMPFVTVPAPSCDDVKR